MRSAATPNAPFSAARACSTLSRERQQMAIRAPSAANAEAQARPMPFEPPVMRTILPSNSSSMSGSHAAEFLGASAELRTVGHEQDGVERGGAADEQTI